MSISMDVNDIVSQIKAPVQMVTIVEYRTESSLTLFLNLPYKILFAISAIGVKISSNAMATLRFRSTRTGLRETLEIATAQHLGGDSGYSSRYTQSRKYG